VHIEDNPAVSAFFDLPLQAELVILVFPVGNQVAAFSALRIKG